MEFGAYSLTDLAKASRFLVALAARLPVSEDGARRVIAAFVDELTKETLARGFGRDNAERLWAQAHEAAGKGGTIEEILKAILAGR